ncbi:MAG: metalloregulator ArsR/SmtB family transcription factor [Desulfovibrio sp.]|nr:metalloregulator ArsR/SmtB family transcription factor [Desulfovibrio sp.]
MAIQMFKALADETRSRLIRILYNYELSVNELVQILGMGQSRVSRHLKILAGAELLSFRRDGLWVFYTVPASGRGRDFLEAVMPFMPSGKAARDDISLAARLLEERARKARQFFNDIADSWDDLNREILGDFDLPSRVFDAMPRPCAVAADLGCGTGEVAEGMLARADTVIGVDGSARMLELCRGRLGPRTLADGRASLRIGELSHLPLADQEANFACINLVLHHLARPKEIFREIQRVLKPGGALFVADFLRHNDETMRLRYGDHWLGFDCAEMESAIREAGFEIGGKEISPVGRELRLFMITAKIPRNL